MNSSIATDTEIANHTFTNVEFTGIFDRRAYSLEPNIDHIYFLINFHLFIKYGDKVYIDVGFGDIFDNIVISFDELQKNKYLKHYYDLSLMLAKDKHLLVEDLKSSESSVSSKSGYEFSKTYYKEDRFWYINTTFINANFDMETKKGYYKINPYDLENMEYSSQEDLDKFNKKYMMKGEIINGFFEKYCEIFNKIAIDSQSIKPEVTK
jgi:hypothetical protein